MKLLYVDDKKTWHKLFEIVLSLRGVDVLHAYTPKEALNVASLEKPNVAVVDVSLSNGTGYDVIPDLVRLGVPVILIGYKAEGFDREKALSMGAYGALEKPFTVEEFLDLLRDLKKKAPELKEQFELTVPQEGEFEVVNLEPETHELESAEPELPVIPVEGELEEKVPVVPVEIEEEKEEEVPVEPVEEKTESTEEELPAPATEPVVAEAKEEVKRKAEEVSGITVPEEKVEEIIREIAWEVVPEIAERVIREEIEKLIRSRLA